MNQGTIIEFYYFSFSGKPYGQTHKPYRNKTSFSKFLEASARGKNHEYKLGQISLFVGRQLSNFIRDFVEYDAAKCQCLRIVALLYVN